MTRRTLCIRADAEVTEAIATLASRGVRRAPVISPTGKLVGVLSLDDLPVHLAGNLRALALAADVRSRPARHGGTTGREKARARLSKRFAEAFGAVHCADGTAASADCSPGVRGRRSCATCCDYQFPARRAASLGVLRSAADPPLVVAPSTVVLTLHTVRTDQGDTAATEKSRLARVWGRG